ncbi:TetR/AcrR family transcriptional regulator [Fervidibacillus albus]|uniref:TetR/AcrR family transcriptional regulator n=1 Tax=Fervidibacillus albus TaxID=2980026 RepID=A0A9E8LS62_9BACI|nr:TetR/AcrR family transcriptional regulator [Fervidibacillus albus]WAA08605.1 TetR/AcrR family transcriptional regulator [Fervidibacillus albus]
MTENLMEAMVSETKQKKPTDKKQRIVTVAAELFAEKGYANTSTSEIAKKAEVAEGTIFRHFQTKENLLLSILVPFLKEALPPMAEDVFSKVLNRYTDSPESFFHALITNRYAFFIENKEYFQVFIKELVYNEQIRNEVIPIFQRTVLMQIETAIQTFQEKGKITKTIPSETLTRTAFSIMFGFFLTHLFFQNVDGESNIEEKINQLVHLIMNGMKTSV